MPSPRRLEEAELSTSLSVNLETRRKRKDGQPKLEIRRHSILAQSPKKSNGEAPSILRTGAKRKLGDRETEKRINPPSKDDFTFSRRSASNEKGPLVSSTLLEEGDTVPASPIRQTRRVLGDKSVNMSPRKLPATADEPGHVKDSKEKHNAPRSGSARSQPRSRRASAIPTPMPQEDVLTTVEIAPPLELSLIHI